MLGFLAGSYSPWKCTRTLHPVPVLKLVSLQWALETLSPSAGKAPVCACTCFCHWILRQLDSAPRTAVSPFPQTPNFQSQFYITGSYTKPLLNTLNIPNPDRHFRLPLILITSMTAHCFVCVCIRDVG